MIVGLVVEADSGAVAASLSSRMMSRQALISCLRGWVVPRSAVFHWRFMSSNLEVSLAMLSWSLPGLSAILSCMFLLSLLKSSNPWWICLSVMRALARCLALEIAVMKCSSAKSSASRKASSSSSPGRYFWASSKERLNPASVLRRLSIVCWIDGRDSIATSSGSEDGMFWSLSVARVTEPVRAALDFLTPAMSVGIRRLEVMVIHTEDNATGKDDECDSLGSRT